MHRCTHKAAGGTIQRLKPGFATMWLRSRKENRLISLPSCFVSCALPIWRRRVGLVPSLIVAFYAHFPGEKSHKPEFGMRRKTRVRTFATSARHQPRTRFGSQEAQMGKGGGLE